MSKPRNKYDLLFAGFLLSILVVFVALRPLSSPWHRLINGDGLGYYSYLPAKFIYHDQGLDFKWFNEVHKQHYTAGTFASPEDNFLVPYEGKKINKYYQGLSFIWLPFFLAAHACAQLLHYPADGFSEPYQLFIGLASLFYLFLGLVFLRKLLRRLFDSDSIAAWVPVLLFYGTYLFDYSIQYNSLSHVYSFSFIVLFAYFGYCFFTDASHRLRNLVLLLLFYLLTVCIRPINALSLLMLPAFVPAGFFKQKMGFEKPRALHLFLILAMAGLLFYQLSLMLAQTGSLFANSYSGERFYFGRSKFFAALFSYHLGLFVYAPLFFVSVFGAFYFGFTRRLLLPLFFLLIVFIYASWWYWPIVKRAPIDYYVIPAILLGALAQGLGEQKRKYVLFPLLLLCTVYYQFKDMQLRRGILDEFLTYKELYWRNFFRTGKASMFPVPPSSVIQKEESIEAFEDRAIFPYLSTEVKHGGQSALEVGPQNSVVILKALPYPALFAAKERKKIRLSFWSYFEEGMGQVHVFIQLYDKDHKLLKEEPFYLGDEAVAASRWDYKEFGCEITGMQLNPSTVSRVEFTIWNTEGKKKLYIDDARFEFMLCDESFETPL